MNSMSPVVKGKIGKNLYRILDHPLCTIRNMVRDKFSAFRYFDQFEPIVKPETNFDDALFPPKNSYRKDISFEFNKGYILRTSLTTEILSLLSMGCTSFLTIGDVYRKDILDRYHYPVFHQATCVHLDCSLDVAAFMTNTVRLFLQYLFPNHGITRTECLCPFTHGGTSYKIQHNGQWVNVLSCGILREEIINECGLNGEKGWIFNLGLDRVAMILFDIPDIRFLWSNNDKFLGQFKDNKITKFTPFSNQPSKYRDICFFPKHPFAFSDFYIKIREISNDLVESVDLLGVKDYHHYYRLNYRSIDDPIEDKQIDEITKSICELIFPSSLTLS